MTGGTGDGTGGELRLMCALVAEVSGPAALFVESGFG